MEKAIGIGEYCISDNTEDIFKIYGLSSCIGMIMYCPIIKVLGVGHFLLPESRINNDLSKINPAYFVDTGIDIMIEEIVSTYGYKKEQIELGVYGGAEARIKNGIFNIGARNIVAVKKKLAQHGMKIKNSDTGGRFSRTICVCVKDGKTFLQLQKSIESCDMPMTESV